MESALRTGGKPLTPRAVRRTSPLARPDALHVVFPLVLGGALYLGWRSPHLLVHHWLQFVGLGAALASLQAAVACVRPPSPVVLSLPDALWAYALVAHLGRLWRDCDGTPGRFVWVGGAVLLSVGSEVGQLAGIVPGTFDPLDLASLSIACLLAMLFLPTQGGPS